MIRLPRVVRLDESDGRVYHRAAAAGEWAIPGGFVFSDATGEGLAGRMLQAFVRGWLGLDSFGHATLVAVAEATGAEREAAIDRLAHHFVAFYNAPSPEQARPVASAEIAFAEELCREHPPDTLLMVEREFTPDGIRESFRVAGPGFPGASRRPAAPSGDAPEDRLRDPAIRNPAPDPLSPPPRKTS